MQAYILSIGSELLKGHVTDTNATFLAQELTAIGVDLVGVMQVGDDEKQIVDAIAVTLERAELVICTGGIGPTDDDRTREAIATTVGEKPKADPELLANLRGFFAARGQDMPKRNAKQAWVIPSSSVLPNPVGTAPGWFVQTPGDSAKTIVAMPGVPHEMKRMWREQALPRIQEVAGQRIHDTVIVKTLGIGESAAEELIHDLVVRPDPIVATYAKDDGVHIHITALGDDPDETRSRRDRTLGVVKERLQQHIWGYDADSLPLQITAHLKRANIALKVVEHGTGGAFQALFGSDLSTFAAVRESRILPIEIGLTESAGAAIAAAYAKDAASSERGALGFGMSMAVEREEGSEDILSGKLMLAVARQDGKARMLPAVQLRSSLQEIQRRGALHALDVLRGYLIPT